MQNLGAINIFRPRLYGKKVVAEKAETALASVYKRKKLTLFLSQQLSYILRLSKIALTHVQMVSPRPS